MSCATKTIKYLVFIFNTLCALFGIGTIVVNALALSELEDEGRWVCIFMIVLGSIVFVISFFGCCGAIKENVCFMGTYSVFLIILLVMNSVILFGYISHIDGEEHARQVMDRAWAKQINGTDAMSFYQNEYHCCGKTSSDDYVHDGLVIPESCYVGGSSSNNSTLYTIGCLDFLIGDFYLIENRVLIFSWITLGVEFVALVCACILSITFRNQQRRSRY